VCIYGENAVPVPDIDEFKGHIGSPFHCIFIATGRAETGVAAERDKFKFSAVRASIHGTAIGGIPAVNHFINVFHLAFTGMEGVLDFFIIVGKDFL